MLFSENPHNFTFLIDIPRSAGARNQVEIARQLAEIGVKVVFITDMTRDQLPIFASSHSISLDYPVVFMKEFLADIEGIVLREAILEASVKNMPEYNQKVFQALLAAYRADMADAAAAFEKIRPSAMLVADDGVACNAFLTTAAKACGVPIFCCPYGYGGREDLEKDALLRQARGEGYDTTSPGGDIVAGLVPKWISAGRIYLRPEVILAREAVGVSVDRPWAIYGSEADVFCAPAAQYLDFLAGEGFDAGKVEVVGSPTGTLIGRNVAKSAALSASFRQPRKIEAGRTKVLVALPPSYHASRGHLTGFPAYQDVVREVLAPFLKRRDVDLVISLHPATSEADRKFFEPYVGAVSARNIFELISEADVFVTDFSSTVRWAIACGIPTLNYDIYRFDLDAYVQAPAVLTVTSHSEYTALLERLLYDENFYEQISARQIEVADRWGVIDRDFASRIVALVAARRF